MRIQFNRQINAAGRKLSPQAFLRYRRSRGTKRGVWPDFYIGAHAAVMQWPVLTRDVGRYRTYFPTVSLIAP